MMAKLTDFKTPTGASGNLLNPMDWLPLIFGTVVLFITFAAGQNIAGKLNGKGGGFIDTSIEPITKSQAPAVLTRGERVI